MNYTNLHNLPDSIAEAIKKETYDLKPNQNVISITQLINPPIIRQLYLRHSADIEEDISENVWRLLGSAVHSILERTNQFDKLLEERISCKIGDVEVTGKADLYEGKTYTIHDYKCTSAWNLVYKDKDDKQWENQLNCYAWLFRKVGLKVEKLQIITILRDWAKSKALQSKDYPQIPIIVVDIPIWDLEKQENYVKEAVSRHIAQRDLPDEQLEICSEKNRWAGETKYALMKQGRKSAVKLYDDLKSAEYVKEAVSRHIAQKDYYIVERKGVDKRCEGYCAVSQWCSYGKNVCEVNNNKE